MLNGSCREISTAPLGRLKPVKSMRLGGLRNAISQISDERQLPGRRGMTYGHQNLEEGETVVLPIAYCPLPSQAQISG